MERFLLLITMLILVEACASESNRLDRLVARRDTIGLRLFLKKWDTDFVDDWRLKSAGMEEIGHFERGLVLEWSKNNHDTLRSRSYVFDMASKFVDAHEKRFLNDTLLSQGEVYFENRQVRFIRQVIINKNSLKKEDSRWYYDVEGYQYEIFENGELVCIYRTIHLNHFYMLFEKQNQDKIELVAGPDCLGLENK